MDQVRPHLVSYLVSYNTYRELDVLRTCHVEDFILERTDMPDENIRNVQGEMVFEEEQPLVCTCLLHCLCNT